MSDQNYITKQSCQEAKQTTNDHHETHGDDLYTGMSACPGVRTDSVVAAEEVSFSAVEADALDLVVLWRLGQKS